MSAEPYAGPAFPVVFEHSDGQAVSEHFGMDLRDYAAIHSTQPGCEEICKCAGVGYDGLRVYVLADDKAGISFNEWWRAQSLERMCELSAMVRYAQADAMLKARQS